jgi:SAM-dependent methyltransferase
MMVNLELENQPVTMWEVVATTRWGRYTTEVAENAVLAAAEMAGTPGAALEVGCEGGRWSRLLSNMGWALTCTDIDANVLAVCQQRVPTANCIHVSPRATTLPCAARCVSLLLCLEVFPVMDSSWFAKEANRVLTGNGVLVGVTLNRMSVRGMFVRAKQFLTGKSEFYNSSYVEWRRRMEAAGFTITFQRGYCWFPLPRSSNSLLAPFFISIERWLGLDRLPALSPWVVFIARKTGRSVD